MIKPLRPMAKSYSIGTRKGEYMKYTIKMIGGGLFTRTYKQLNSNFRKRGGRYLVCHLGDDND